MIDRKEEQRKRAARRLVAGAFVWGQYDSFRELPSDADGARVGDIAFVMRDYGNFIGCTPVIQTYTGTGTPGRWQIPRHGDFVGKLLEAWVDVQARLANQKVVYRGPAADTA